MIPLLFVSLGLATEPSTVDSVRAFDNVVRQVGSGRVDWTDLLLVVDSRSDRTVGAWKDRRIQEQDALDSIIPRMDNAARSVPVTAESAASDLFTVGGEVGERLEEGSRGWQIEETRYHQGGGVEMSASLDLRTWLLPAIKSLSTAGAVQLDKGADAPTGLVIDARGLPFVPSLVPSISTVDERPIVRVQLLGAAADVRAAPIVYVTDPADPRAYARAGERPLFAQAAAARGAELILAAGSEIGDDPRVPSLVAAQKVVVVVDP